ncbi:hypothetical protein PACTADRAFT_48498 [Pachysolen tannophilus NRRL Y-2460]|uniref:Calcofluor white hypersensitive protein n=1 Tax=Pachysolen tannophilus NRRL Y-2460 TaxID=669874 RepID=A0A1E4TY48_PACTA|nr:hypothetical protein PACTADRAFT_48498 [Pachysolen tannophilus NRRL Y-2460]
MTSSSIVTPIPTPIIQFNAVVVAYAHTICAFSAFIAALIVGVALHYDKIVQNAHYGYPDEWFPSVSATIGDRYPERSIFQILIALTSGPRFLLIFLCYLKLYKKNSIYNKIILIVGILRTVTCGGWVYITSTDDHDFHDIFMISYIVLTLPWTISITKLSPIGSSLKFGRIITAATFFGALGPLIYLFIQHKVHRVAGAYSYYAYIEWSLIFLDIAFDAWTIKDFKDIKIQLIPSENGSVLFEINSVPTPISTETTIETTNGFQNGNGTAVTEKISRSTQSVVKFGYFQFLVNVINSYMYWTITTSIFLCVWHFPLWHMGISGYEAVIMTLMSPVVLLSSTFRKFVTEKPQIPRLFSVIFGIGSYKIQDPANRLLLIAVATFFVVLALANEINYVNKFLQKNSLSVKFYSASFTVGLLASSVCKLAFKTNNPIWPIMHEANGGYNMLGLAIGLFGAFFTPRIQNDSQPAKIAKGKESAILTGLGLGALMFILSAILTDSSTIILWSWDGYPVHGPTPIPHGPITLLSMSIGIYLGLSNLEFVSTWKYFIIGNIGSIIMYLFSGWYGYFGGLIYTVFLCSIVPVIFIPASRLNPGLVFFIGYFVDMMLSLGHVWVVAYAFVPGGWLLRERTDILLLVTNLFLACGLIGYKLINKDDLQKEQEEEAAKSSLKLSDVVSKTLKILTILTAISAYISYKRFDTELPVPYHEEEKLFTAGIWTIHFGLDNDMWASEERMIDLIRDAELDIVGLLETDTQRLIMGNRDLTQNLGEKLGMYTDYGPGPNKHTWGCALLSKFPILNSTHHLLSSPVGELAPAIHATLDVYGEMVDVVVFHSGQEEDVEDRRLQALEIADIMGSSDKPMILLSYLVTDPLEGNYNTYVSDYTGMHDIDPTDWDRWCEYILFKKLKRIGYARISRSSITDTELQVGKFLLWDKEIDEQELYANERIEEEEVLEPFRFPSKFYGDGIRDHRFHVFDEPRYFA